MTTASLRAIAALALALLAGCGGAAEEAKRRIEELGGVRATFGVRAGAREAIVRILRDRVEARDVHATVEAAGEERIELTVAGRPPERARAAIETLTAAGRVAFYDWEANVIGPRGVPAPQDPAVTGGVAAGLQGAMPLREAVLLARRRPAVADGDNTHAGLWYALGREVAGPFPTRAEAEARADGGRVAHVRPGTVLLREQAAEGAGDGERWFVLEDDPALTNEHIVDPRQRVATRSQGEPIVTFGFTEEGRRRFEALTRAIAQRAASSATPGAPPEAVAQHFAIALDDELITVPYIDFEEHPDGIDADNGSQLQGGFTVERAQAVAALLRAGPLPPGALVQEGEEVVPPR